jgi:methionyl-tRNA formyltransferase
MSNSQKIRLYFLGSGEIAVPVLEAVSASAKIDLVGIGTQKDQPAGRHRMLQETPIAKFAPKTGAPLDKFESLNAPESLAYLADLDLDIILVVSFGQILREPVLNLPRHGCMNVHSSLLPRFRGASPITNAILNRDSVTGVTFMRMDKGLDTGGVFCTLRYPLIGNEYSDDLEKALGRFAAEHIVEVVDRIVSGKMKPVPQNHQEAVITRKIKKQDGAIDWSLAAEDVEARIRAYHPWPGAYFVAANPERCSTIKVTAARVIGDRHGTPGRILQADRHGWVVACGRGAIELIRIVPQGRKEMGSPDFLNGFKLTGGMMVFGGAEET